MSRLTARPYTPRGNAAVWWGIAGLTVLAAALRFTDLGGQSYWGDEALTVSELHGSLTHTMSLALGQETTPPLYFVVAWIWTQFFGTGEVGLRSLSAVAGVALIPLAYLVGVTVAGRRLGMLVAALVAFNPFLIWYSQEARAYSLFIALSAVSWLFFLRYARGGRRNDLILWTAASVLALVTHFFAVFIVGAQCLWLLYREWPNARWALAAVGLWTLALLPMAIEDLGHGVGWIADTPLEERLATVPSEFLIGRLAQWSQAGPLLVLIAVAVSGLVCSALVGRNAMPSRPARALVIAVSAAALGPIVLALAGADFIDPRNMSALWLPVTIVFAAAGLRKSAVLGGAVGIVVAAGGLAATIAIASNPTLQKTDWRAVVRALGPAHRARVVIADAPASEPLAIYLRSRPARARPQEISEIDIVRRVQGTAQAKLCNARTCRPAPKTIPNMRLGRPISPYRRVGELVVGRWTVHRRRLGVSQTRAAVTRLVHRLNPAHPHTVGIYVQPAARKHRRRQHAG
jgi:4-amino-4-deoxy-L-arabinose transferase-like glycosyltransferase